MYQYLIVNMILNTGVEWTKISYCVLLVLFSNIISCIRPPEYFCTKTVYYLLMKILTLMVLNSTKLNPVHIMHIKKKELERYCIDKEIMILYRIAHIVNVPILIHG